MQMDAKRECAACRHAIDAAARLCPYCGADPESGEKPVDTQALLNEVFHSRPQLSTTDSVMEFARHRQGIVIAITLAVAFLILGVLHQFVTARNNSDVSNNPAVPLTEITDLSDRGDENKPIPLPALDYQHDGRAQTMRTYIVEPGAVVPPEVVAAQQAQAAAAAAAQHPATPLQPGAAVPAPRPAAAPAQSLRR